VTLRASVALTLGALDLDVVLEVGPGEVVAVMGPNGAGKTTLLRALAGLTALDDGRVEVAGTVLEDTASGLRLPAEQRRAGVVFQDPLLFPHMTVADNVAFALRTRGTGGREARLQAAAWLERIGLAGVAGLRPGALSGGQAQRVALIRALAGAPGMLLLDEPLSGVDLQARVAVRRELRRHLDTFPGPCLLVTHEPVEALSLADRLVVLEHGRVAQEGSVAEVARRPRSSWIAALVGLNLYRGTVWPGRVELAGGRRLFASANGGQDGDEVFAVVRPAAVALHRERPAGSPRNAWAGTVESVDVQGDRVRVAVGGALPIVAEVTPAAVAELRLEAGDPIWVAVKASEVELYPA